MQIGKRKKEKSTDYSQALTKAQVREMKKKRGRMRKRLTVQRTIPYEAITADGICRVTESFFAKAIRFYDINYTQVDEEDKEYVVRALCGMVNRLDPSVRFQYCLTKHRVDLARVLASIALPEAQGDLAVYRDDFMKLYEKGLKEGKNRFVTEKYIIIGTTGRDKKSVRGKLERVAGEVISALSGIDCAAREITGEEWLEALFHELRPFTSEKLSFSYPMLAGTGLSTKDFIAPDSLDFRESGIFRMGNAYCAAVSVHLTGETMDTEFLGRLMDIDGNTAISIHLEAIDQEAALRMLSNTLTGSLSDQVSEEQRATNEGYGHDLIPIWLRSFGEDVRKTLEQVQAGEDRLFNVCLIMRISETSRRGLFRILDEVSGICRQHGAQMRRMTFRQEEGLAASLPLCMGDLDLKTTRTSRVVGGLVPFTGCEVFDTGGEALYAGRNKVTGNLIMIDRKLSDNGNGLILGVPGSGKSFSTKEEIVGAYFATDDDILICDPESEYAALVSALHGETIVISPSSKTYLNPLDLLVPEGEDPMDAVRMKISFVDSLMELMVRATGSDAPLENSVIDVCAGEMYDAYLQDPDPARMPTLEDLYRRISSSGRPGSEMIAARMERFVFGSADLFSHRTNVDAGSRIVCFDIQNLGDQLKAIAQLTIQDFVWGRVRENAAKGKYTRYFMDEFHVLLRDPQTAQYTVDMYKRFRKKGGILTGITQNVTDLLSSEKAANILSNSEYIRILKQRGHDAELLQKHLAISTIQMREITGSRRGSGLIFLGDKILPFEDEFPRDLSLYRLMTTSPKDRE